MLVPSPSRRVSILPTSAYNTDRWLEFRDSELESRYVESSAHIRRKRFRRMWCCGMPLGLISLAGDRALRAAAHPLVRHNLPSWLGAAVGCAAAATGAAASCTGRTLTSATEVGFFLLSACLASAAQALLTESWDALFVGVVGVMVTVSASSNSLMFRHAVFLPCVFAFVFPLTLSSVGAYDDVRPSHALIGLVGFSVSTLEAYKTERSRRHAFFTKDLARRAVLREEQLRCSLADAKRTLVSAQGVVNAVIEEGGALLSSFHIAASDIQKHESIGEGGFGTVVRATWRGLDVAVKTMRCTAVTRENVRRFKDEIQIMARVHHPNLVRLLGACWQDGPDNLCIVLEYCSSGTLTNVWDRHASTQPTDHDLTTAVTLLRGVASCCKYLHHEQPTEPLIHRDLKPDNVLLTQEWTPKVADFGEARRVADDGDMTVVGTAIYCAPEVLRGDAYDTSADVYSFAFILFDAGCGGAPQSLVRVQCRGRHCAHPVPPPALRENPMLWPLITACWSLDPSARPDFRSVYDALLGRSEGAQDEHTVASDT